jgi:hypothetical protein
MGGAGPAAKDGWSGTTHRGPVAQPQARLYLEVRGCGPRSCLTGGFSPTFTTLEPTSKFKKEPNRKHALELHRGHRRSQVTLALYVEHGFRVGKAMLPGVGRVLSGGTTAYVTTDHIGTKTQACNRAQIQG